MPDCGVNVDCPLPETRMGTSSLVTLAFPPDSRKLTTQPIINDFWGPRHPSLLPPNQRETVSWSTPSTWRWPTKTKYWHGRRIVGSLYAFMMSSDEIVIWKYIAGLFHCRDAWLHRSRDISATRLWERVWLVVTWGDYVWMSSWIPAFLLRFHSWNISKNRPLASLPHVSWRCISKPRSRRPDTTVRKWYSLLVSNILIWPF
jgi:hypothetical protein